MITKRRLPLTFVFGQPLVFHYSIWEIFKNKFQPNKQVELEFISIKNLVYFTTG